MADLDRPKGEHMGYRIMADDELPMIDRRVETHERIVRLETVIGAIDRRVAQLGERSHDQAQALTQVVLQVQTISDTVERIEVKIDKNQAETYQKIADNRLDAAAEHKTLRDLMTPLREDYYNRQSVAVYEEKRRAARDRRWGMLLGFGGGVMVLLFSWLLWRLGLGPSP